MPPHLVGPARTDYLLFGIGGALLAASTLLPWVSVVFVGSINLFRLTTAANSLVLLPWAMVLIGVAITVAVVLGARLDRLAIASVITVVVALLAGGGDLVSLVRAVTASHGSASLDIGMFAALAALVLLTVGAIRVHRVRSGLSAWPQRAAPQQARPNRPVPRDVRPGWKPDPWGIPGHVRYWDGQSWWPDTQ